MKNLEFDDLPFKFLFQAELSKDSSQTLKQLAPKLTTRINLEMVVRKVFKGIGELDPGHCIVFEQEVYPNSREYGSTNAIETLRNMRFLEVAADSHPLELKIFWHHVIPELTEVPVHISSSKEEREKERGHIANIRSHDERRKQQRVRITTIRSHDSDAC